MFTQATALYKSTVRQEREQATKCQSDHTYLVIYLFMYLLTYLLTPWSTAPS